MSDPVKANIVKATRTYDSSGRREHARRTRWAVLQAARELFLQSGYAATTVAGIARHAGVSVETVYKAFENKPGLLKAVFDVAIAGDDDPVPIIDRDFVHRVNAEPDARTKFALYGEHLAATAPRAAPIQLLVRQAAGSDPGAAAVWEQLKAEARTGMSHFAAHLVQGDHLRPGVTFEEARDVLYLAISESLYERLVVDQGWTPERYGRWVAAMLTAALLP